jgi:hypothetical protein
VLDVLKNGHLDRSEDWIQTALERILSVPFHKRDWGGEQNDLYTADGDQLLRLCSSPARLLVVQFVGTVSEAVVSDVDGKIRHSHSQGKDAWYCIMDGQDTARVLRAYGEL